MTCGSCQRENPTDAVFCGGCGIRLEPACPACGRARAPHASYCSGCGRPLTGEAPLTDSRAPLPGSPGQPTAFASDRYRVSRFLGEGGGKRVYLARDDRLERNVAMSLIKSDLLESGTREQVLAEARAMGRLGDHPNVVTIYDVAEEASQLYIVSEYLPGGDLESRLAECEKRQLPVPDALRIASQICAGLAHAHAHRIVHRDLKPSNIWFTGDGTAKLGDFGLAASLGRSRLPSDGMMIGTMAYMAPEQALGQAPDIRSDLYALGAVLYEMLAGRPPFLGDDAVAIISQHINSQPVAPSWHNPNVGNALEELVLQLLQKDVGQRPGNAVQVQEALDEIAAAKADERAIHEDESSASPLDRLAGGVFVGRAKELDKLRKSFDAVLAGRGAVVTLVGEPGIGKTRTAEELSTYAQMRGAQVLWGRCYEGEGAPSYWPWVQIIRSYVHSVEPAALRSEMGPGAADIAEVVSQVRECLPDLPRPPDLEPEQARFRLFDSVTSFLCNAARRTPLVLVLDDLHWADLPSLLLLEFMVREIGQARVLVIATLRDVEATRQPALEAVLGQLSRQPGAQQLALEGVSDSDVSRFIELTAGAQLDSLPALSAAIYRETEGNPLFMHELLRLLEANGRLDPHQAPQISDLEIPHGVRRVLEQRLRLLSDECQQLLTLASVIGRDFDLKVLRESSGLAAQQVVALLDEAEAARIVQREQTASARFSHGLIRDLVHDGLPAAERIQLHHRVAVAYESVYEAKGRHLADLAYHFCEAQPGEDLHKAIDYAVRAAESARTSRAYEEAVRHGERALEVLALAPADDEHLRCDLLLSLATARLTLQGAVTEEVREEFRRAGDLARELGLAEHFGRAAVGFASSPVPALVDHEAIARLEEALERLDEDDTLLRVRILSILARQRASEPSGQSLAVAREAVKTARRLSQKEPLLSALESWLRATWSPENAHERLAAADEMLALADDSSIWMSQARLWRITMLMELGDIPAVDVELRIYTAEAEALRIPSNLQLAKMLHAMRSLLRGDFEEADRYAEEVIAIRARASGSASRPGDPLADQFAGIMFVLRREQGRLPELEAAIEGFAKLYGNPLSRAALAFLYTELGRTADARRELERLLPEQIREIPRDWTWLMTMSLLAEVATDVGDIERARVLYELLQPFSDRVVISGNGIMCGGAAARFIGLLAGVLDEGDAARQYFEEAVDLNTRIGAKPFLAYTEHDTARMLLQGGNPDDSASALNHANRALTLAQQLGMKFLVDRAVATKLEAQGVSPTDTMGSVHAVASTVRRARPDLSPAVAPDGSVTLMFSDMEDYTGMVERLGDVASHQIVETHNAIVREQLAAHGGYEVELRGDGFLLAFARARQGVLCGIALQQAITRYAQEHEGFEARLRIGLHTGEAIRDQDSFFGKTVIEAFRISDLAAGGEILVSSLTRDLAQAGGNLEFDDGREVTLKGLSGAHRLFAVQWSPEANGIG